MGLIVIAAAGRGAATGGRSRFFQSVLAGFGLHGIGHLALSAAGVRHDDLRTWLGAIAVPPPGRLPQRTG